MAVAVWAWQATPGWSVRSGAVFTPTISSGIITAISLTSAGGGYTTAPNVVAQSTTGPGASITCSILPALDQQP